MCPPTCCCGFLRFSYRGHYIVLTGFNDSSGMFTMEDPSSPCSSCVSPADLDAARLAFGTDEDLLVVSKCQPDALRKGYTGAEQGNVYLQTKLPGHVTNLNQVQKGSSSNRGDSETVVAGGMLQMQRILQMSNRDRDASGNSSQEREALFPGNSASARNNSS